MGVTSPARKAQKNAVRRSWDGRILLRQTDEIYPDATSLQSESHLRKTRPPSAIHRRRSDPPFSDKEGCSRTHERLSPRLRRTVQGQSPAQNFGHLVWGGAGGGRRRGGGRAGGGEGPI